MTSVASAVDRRSRSTTGHPHTALVVDDEPRVRGVVPGRDGFSALGFIVRRPRSAPGAADRVPADPAPDRLASLA